MASHLTVVGLGKLGFPLSVYYASRGAQVRGVDVNADRLDSLLERTTIDLDTELDLRSTLDALPPGALSLGSDTQAAVSESNVVIVVVPVIARTRGNVDFSAMEMACADVAAGLKPGTTVIFETTLPIGTTRNRLLPILERSGLKGGKGFFLAFSPERVLVGRIFTDLARYPKIVGGIDDASGKMATRFYSQHLSAPVWQVRDAETAEMVKLAETCFRTTSIAFANELAMLADQKGIDVFEVIKCANSQPYSSILEPGIGVGGHCLPVYPFLMEASGFEAPLIERGRTINASMGSYGVAKLAEKMGDLRGKRVLILGVAFRSGVQETAFSPAFDVRDSLSNRGAEVFAIDPLFTDEQLWSLGFIPCAEGDRRFDAIILQAAHPTFKTFDVRDYPTCRAVLDGRNFLDRSTIEAAGVQYMGIGS